MTGFRIEKDTLGEVKVPSNAWYGAQSARAAANFPISELKPSPSIIWSILIIKRAAAVANMATGRLDRVIGDAIITAADEALSGKFNDQFIVDPFQAGAGTSHNMNANEIIANRASNILGSGLGSYKPVHPNDHVNMAQSTNDVFPTAMRLAVICDIYALQIEIDKTREALHDKGVEFSDILKSGRTHLQDAVPITLGQEFEAYSAAVEKVSNELEYSLNGMYELGIGGTAVGTGLNAESQYIEIVVEELKKATGYPLRNGENLIERMQNMAPFLSVSSTMKSLAVTFGRIANDLRLLASGPRTGFDEIRLPPVQPGSSIMPGKVNPSMAEMLNMVCFQAIGSDASVTAAVNAGQLELNVMMPVIAFNLLFTAGIFKNSLREFRERCVKGITANRGKCLKYLHDSLGMVTVLAPHIGYHKSAEIAQEADRTGESIIDVIKKLKVMDDELLEKVLCPDLLTMPGVPGKN